MAQRCVHGSPETISLIQPCLQPSTTLNLIILRPEEEVDHHDIGEVLSQNPLVQIPTLTVFALDYL